MIIDLTDLMKNFESVPVVLKIGGKHHDVEELTIEQAQKLDSVADLKDEDALALLIS